MVTKTQVYKCDMVCESFKILLKLVIDYKGLKSEFTGEKPGSHHLSQRSQLVSSLAGQITIMYQPIKRNEKNTASLM